MRNYENTTTVWRTISLRMPATLRELERFCERLRNEGLGGDQEISCLHTVDLVVKLAET